MLSLQNRFAPVFMKPESTQTASRHVSIKLL